MRVTELQVENYQKISFVSLALRPGITEISGRNGAGKTSAINAVAVWLDGLKVAPAEPIRNGAERARIRGRLGEMYVTRTITRKKSGGHETELRFEGIDGKSYPATQRQLSDLIGEHNLDPLDFINLDTKGKFNALRSFVPGFDFEKAALDHKAEFTRRTDASRIARESRAAAALILVPEGTDVDPPDEQALVAQLAQAGTTNADIERRRINRENAMKTIQAARAVSARVETEVAIVTQRTHVNAEVVIRGLEAQIAALQAQIGTVKANVEADIRRESDRLRETAAAGTREADELQAKIDGLGPLPQIVDVAALSKRIDDARKANQGVVRAQERAKHVIAAEKYEAEAQTLTEAMKAREVAKQKAIATANLPISGIEFGDGEIRYQGAPFEQASTAQKLKVAIARIVALNPKLRLAWIRDASLLDDESYAELQKLAIEFDCDILIETVRPIGKDAVVLHDGRVKEVAEQSEAVTA